MLTCVFLCDPTCVCSASRRVCRFGMHVVLPVLVACVIWSGCADTKKTKPLVETRRNLVHKTDKHPKPPKQEYVPLQQEGVVLKQGDVQRFVVPPSVRLNEESVASEMTEADLKIEAIALIDKLPSMSEAEAKAAMDVRGSELVAGIKDGSVTRELANGAKKGWSFPILTFFHNNGLACMFAGMLLNSYYPAYKPIFKYISYMPLVSTFLLGYLVKSGPLGAAAVEKAKELANTSVEQEAINGAQSAAASLPQLTKEEAEALVNKTTVVKGDTAPIPDEPWYPGKLVVKATQSVLNMFAYNWGVLALSIYILQDAGLSNPYFDTILNSGFYFQFGSAAILYVLRSSGFLGAAVVKKAEQLAIVSKVDASTNTQIPLQIHS